MGYEPNELPLLHPAPLPERFISQKGLVPPILFKPSSVSSQVIPDLATPGLPGVTQPHHCRCDETERYARPPHLAPSCTLAQPTALPRIAGGLLPHRFTPYPGPITGMRPMAGLFSVAVVVTAQLLASCPHLLFREATLPAAKGRLGVGKFLYPAKPGSDGSPHLTAESQVVRYSGHLRPRRLLSGVLDRIRTCGLSVRSAALYPTELRGRAHVPSHIAIRPSDCIIARLILPVNFGFVGGGVHGSEQVMSQTRKWAPISLRLPASNLRNQGSAAWELNAYPASSEDASILSRSCSFRACSSSRASLSRSFCTTSGGALVMNPWLSSVFWLRTTAASALSSSP